MTRDLRLDILRVLSILAVILIRVTTVYESSDEFYYESLTSWFISLLNRSLFWCIPILFMLSGALLLNNSNESIQEFYKKRMAKVLIPTLFWSIFFLSYLYIVKDYSLFNLVGVFIKFGAFDHLWFMYAIIGLYIFTPYLRIALQHLPMPTLKNLIITIFIFTIGNSILGQYFGSQGTILSFFIGYIGYFLLGYYLYKNKEKYKKYTHLFGLLFLILIVLSSFLDIIREYYLHLNITFFTILLPLQSILLFLYILNTKFTLKLPADLWAHLSVFSFGTYLIHALFILLMEPYMTMDKLIYLPIFYLLVLVCSYISVYLLSKVAYLKSLV